jgi:hypothetical protein
MITTTTERINYEVVWGPYLEDRNLYVDYGDADISTTADVRAARTFLDMVKAGVRVGFYRNGVLEAGEDPIYPEEV